MGFNRFYWFFQGAVSNTNNNQWTAGALKENLNQY
jgi:hypothetical protein